MIRRAIQKFKELGVKNPNICEIGVFDGENARNILENFKDCSLVLIDIDYRDAVKKNLSGFEDRCVYIVKDSCKAANLFPDEIFDLIYIDGDHTYPGVMSDMKAWYPKLVKGGLFAGHDYFNDTCKGVRVAVNRFAKSKGKQVYTIDLNIEKPTYDNFDWWFIK